ncbi:DUF4129 domain-containing protein [halophilic archaeon]|nr:DUF4129 domain-containing protein [halophilic archaeon]
MDLDNARPIAVALLCVLAIALAAATLNTAVTSENSGGSGLGWGDGGVGVSQSNDTESESTGDGQPIAAPIELPCFPVLNTLPAVLAILGGFVALVGFAYRRRGWLGALAVVGPVGVPTLFLHALLSACSTSPFDRPGSLLPNGSNGTSLPSGGTGGMGDGGATTVTPSTVLLLVLGVALVGALALLVRTSSGNELDEPEAETPPDDPDVAAVGRAAGDAADRIESNASVENEVYRAWREMTEHLDVAAPQSSTPREFATAAVEAGMDRSDVDELTNVFEVVRYGGESPTGERERRAVEALRRIEREYADADSDGDATGGEGSADGGER